MLRQLLLSVSVLCALSTPAWAGWDEAKSAYDAGDLETAFSEFRTQARLGDPLAQFNLGVMYLSGQGVPADDAEALRWHQLAGYQGLFEAQLTLGFLYYLGPMFGRGTPQDLEEAERWFRRAAEQGPAEAQFWLGKILEESITRPGNAAEALEWYRLAAEQGFKEAQENLAEMYRSGRGAQANDIEALKWYVVASGDCRAAVVEAINQLKPIPDPEIIIVPSCIDAFNTDLTQQQMGDALRLADQFTARLSGGKIEPLRLELIFPEYSAGLGEYENDAAPKAEEERLVAEPAAAETPARPLVDPGKTEERLGAAAEGAADNGETSVASIDPIKMAGSQSLLLEASDDGKTGAVPLFGTVDWSKGTDEVGLPTLVGTASIPARNLGVDVLIRKNSDPSLPASHLMEINFRVGDSFIGGSVAGLPGVLLKNEELVQGAPLVGASARVVGNSFLFTLSASPEDVTANNNLLTSRKWIDLAVIYATGKRAIITLEKDAAAETMFTEVFAIWSRQAGAVIARGPENVTLGALEDGLAAYDQGDYATALKLLRPLAEQGDAQAQSKLGDMYQHGNGVPWNFAEALVWHKKAADQGDARAQYALGKMFDSAQGVPQDDAEAARWFHLAAEQGNAEAQKYLAEMYLNGRGVSRSDAQFLKWYSLAAAQWPSPEWWLTGGTEGLSFYGGDGSGYSEEDLFFALTCGGGVLSLLIVSDPRNSIVAKALLDSSPFGESVARLEFGGNFLAAQIWGFTVDADDANGGWDLRIGIRPANGEKDFFKTLAEFSGAGVIRAVVAGETFDLTPRKADQHILVEFVRSCGDDRG